MDRQAVLSALGGCFYGEPASCVYACPFHLDLRTFLKKMSRGRFEAAYKELCSYIPFPGIVSAYCPRRCADHCQCASVLGGDAVSVRALERSCLALAKRRETPVYAVPEKTASVAILGAGPAGLSCALPLARRKYRVTVFERASGWGGVLRGVPEFPAFDTEIGAMFVGQSVTFVFNRQIGSADELAGFDAVVLATGEGGEQFGLAASWEEEFLSCNRPGWFLCGGVTGQMLIDGIAAGARVFRSVEAYLQTGSVRDARQDWDPHHACRYVPHEEDAITRAVPADDNGLYSADDARREAGRCLQCECKTCLNVCELIQTYKKAPPRIASDVLQDAQSRNSVSSASITRQTWSCSQCSRCRDKCPEHTDVGAMLRLSRESRVEAKLYPPALHAYWLDWMERSARQTVTWRGPGDTVFFPGCRLGASGPETVLRTFRLLRDSRGTGLFLNCCGIPALWAGERELFDRHIETLRVQWQTLECPTVLTACPSCARVFTEFLPEIPVRSVYEFLPPAEGKGLPGWNSAAVFDPCAAREEQEKKAVRRLSEGCGITLTPLDSDGRCCGFGGHMMLANPELYDTITENRAALSESPYLVYCANCRDIFLARGKRSAHILDVYFGLETPLATLEQKRRNSEELAARLCRELGLAPPETEPQNGETIPVQADADVLRKMERSLISMDDARRVLSIAQTEKTGFLGADGSFLCSARLGHVTVWVRARQTDGTWTLLDVYSHRMEVIR